MTQMLSIKQTKILLIKFNFCQKKNNLHFGLKSTHILLKVLEFSTSKSQKFDFKNFYKYFFKLFSNIWKFFLFLFIFFKEIYYKNILAFWRKNESFLISIKNLSISILLKLIHLKFNQESIDFHFLQKCNEFSFSSKKNQSSFRFEQRLLRFDFNKKSNNLNFNKKPIYFDYVFRIRSKVGLIWILIMHQSISFLIKKAMNFQFWQFFFFFSFCLDIGPCSFFSKINQVQF